MVHAGSNQYEGYEKRNVIKVIKHEEYVMPPDPHNYTVKEEDMRWDLALLKTSKFPRHESDWTKQYLINTICLPNRGGNPIPKGQKEIATLFGYGAISQTSYPEYLQKAQVMAIPCMDDHLICSIQTQGQPSSCGVSSVYYRFLLNLNPFPSNQRAIPADL